VATTELLLISVRKANTLITPRLLAGLKIISSCILLERHCGFKGVGGCYMLRAKTCRMFVYLLHSNSLSTVQKRKALLP
jgi:hypothetical protein